MNDLKFASCSSSNSFFLRLIVRSNSQGTQRTFSLAIKSEFIFQQFVVKNC